MDVIIIISSIVVFAGIVIFVLFFYGIISPYHPIKKAKNNQIKIACVGDSITYGLFVANRNKNNYPNVLNGLLGDNYCVNNFGYTDRTAIKGGDHPFIKEKVYTQSLDFKPDIVIILLGTNDSKENNWDESAFISDYSELIDSYLSIDSHPKVYVLLPPPVFEVRGKVLYQIRKQIIEQEVIPAVEQIAKSMNVEYIDLYNVFANRNDLFYDGVHPTADGSVLLAKTVFEKIAQKM